MLGDNINVFIFIIIYARLQWIRYSRTLSFSPSLSLSLSLFLSLFTIYRFVDSLLLCLAFFAILSLCALALQRLFASANYKANFFFFCARRVDVATLHACHSNAFLSFVLSILSLFPFIAGKVDLREKDPLGKVANETQHGMHREERTARGSNTSDRCLTLLFSFFSFCFFFFFFVFFSFFFFDEKQKKRRWSEALFHQVGRCRPRVLVSRRAGHL